MSFVNTLVRPVVFITTIAFTFVLFYTGFENSKICYSYKELLNLPAMLRSITFWFKTNIALPGRATPVYPFGFTNRQYPLFFEVNYFLF